VSPQPFWLFTSLQLAAIAVLMGVRYVPAAALGGVFMAFVPDVLTRFGHGTVRGQTYDISFDWFQIAVGVLLVVQLILLPDGVWGDLRNRVLHAVKDARLGARAVAHGKGQEKGQEKVRIA
jgi:ABC-type branched-subunit amino acid transport system permease subunit